MIVPACAQSEYRRFGRVDVTHREVEMELLRMVSARPGGSHPVAVRALLHGPPEQVGIEPADLQGIRAVQDDQVKNGLVSCCVGHPINVNGDPDDWRPDFTLMTSDVRVCAATDQ